ncbi:K02A2.6-like [Cordylochernes scorpioides]|uniref:K02A2.6-like n=1 Tax=Cordylochernes scorpioides TaxID=51811 RepID=A0ABY6K5T7_9ARAC|nr:K02A2.6-like [Cordylochernes scorpioides]
MNSEAMCYNEQNGRKRESGTDSQEPHQEVFGFWTRSGTSTLNFYNTPRDGLPSPAQCLFSRRTRTLLPTSTHQLEPEIQKGHPQSLRNKREKQKTHHDKTAKTTRSFKEGEKIMLKQHHREFFPAKVTQEVAPRSYKVQTPTGEYRRNSSFMRYTNWRVQSNSEGESREYQRSPSQLLPEEPGPSGDKEQAQVPEELNTSPRPFSGQEPRSDHQNAEHKNGTLPITTRSGRIIKPPKRFEE